MKVTIMPKREWIEVLEGTPLSEALLRLYPDTDFPCGGEGRCGLCRCVLTTRDGTWEALACRSLVLEDTEVVTRFPLRKDDIDVEIKAGRRSRAESEYGAAVDMGTTTIALSILDIDSGEDIVTVEATNPQVAFGADIMTRIAFCQERKDGTEILQKAMLRKVDSLLALGLERAGIPKRSLSRLVVAGNTCMEHIACGFSPAGLGMAPYRPTFKGSITLDSKTLGLVSIPAVPIFVAPIIGGFVGGDVAAGILATELDKCSKPTVFLDVGTNGEIIGVRDGTMVGVSTAAGPAFEGSGISCGRRAGSGAIVSVRLTDRVTTRTAPKGERPTGLCGSGILSAVAQLVQAGIVEPSGRLCPPQYWVAATSDTLQHIYREEEGEQRIYLADGVYLTQNDIRQVQLAKAALRTGLDVVLCALGLTPEKVERVLIGGAFGSHLDAEDARALGLLPVEFGGKVEHVGNTSLRGARLLAVRPALIELLEKRCRSIEVLNLASWPGFSDLFLENLSLAPR